LEIIKQAISLELKVLKFLFFVGLYFDRRIDLRRCCVFSPTSYEYFERVKIVSMSYFDVGDARLQNH
jgi:hypothetical protein